MNKLFYGDCLTIMQDMNLGAVDLIYLDPPWNSNRAYNAIYRDNTGRELPDQVDAFCDIWTLTPEREVVIKNMPVLMAQAGLDDAAGKLWELWMRALRNTQPRLLAYLLYMTERLIVMKGLLKPTGSIYLHCDPTASHYIKSLMDAIFGHKNFGNEIIWHYKRWPSGNKDFQRMHDVILRYKAGDKAIFNVQYQPYSSKTVHRRMSVDGKTDLAATRDEKRGTKMDDVWDIPYLHSQSKERLGYPTQKPMILLKRIIEASTKKNDIVLDPFCGCATTIAAAHELGRRWIGIDIAYHAIRRVSQVRLAENYGLVEGKNYAVTGVPLTLEGAKNLWQQDKYHFQRWAVERVNGFVTTKRSADGGIDGRLYFSVPGDKELHSMIIEVKGGHSVGVSVWRALRGALDRDEASIAGLIVMEPLSDRKYQNFMREASDMGTLEVMGVQYPRMQILSVPEILDDRMFHTPTVAGRGTGQGHLPLFQAD